MANDWLVSPVYKFELNDFDLDEDQSIQVTTQAVVVDREGAKGGLMSVYHGCLLLRSFPSNCHHISVLCALIPSVACKEWPHFCVQSPTKWFSKYSSEGPRQGQEEESRNSRKELHQTMYETFFRALYTHSISHRGTWHFCILCTYSLVPPDPRTKCVDMAVPILWSNMHVLHALHYTYRVSA